MRTVGEWFDEFKSEQSKLRQKMTDEKKRGWSVTFPNQYSNAIDVGEIVVGAPLTPQQAHEERKQARREYVEAMREGWRKKHGWRNR